MSNECILPYKIKLPPPESITPEEIERRRKLVARTLKLREEIGPVPFSIAEVVRAMREGDVNGSG